MSRSQLAKALELSKKDVPKHPFPLKLIQSSEAWQCDGCEEEQLLTSERYTCSKKDFDYCRRCVENSGTSVISGLLPLTTKDPVKKGVVKEREKKEETVTVVTEEPSCPHTTPRSAFLFYAGQAHLQCLNDGTQLASILTSIYSKWKGLTSTEKNVFDQMAKDDEKRYNLIEKKDSLITYTEKEDLFLFPQGMEILEKDVEKTISVWKHDHNSLCEKCGQIGELLLCEGCNLSYHPTCLQPTLVNIPDEAWLCPECSEQVLSVWEKQDGKHRSTKRVKSLENDSEYENDEDDESAYESSDEEKVKKKKKKKKKKEKKKKKKKKKKRLKRLKEIKSSEDEDDGDDEDTSIVDKKLSKPEIKIEEVRKPIVEHSPPSKPLKKKKTVVPVAKKMKGSNATPSNGGTLNNATKSRNFVLNHIPHIPLSHPQTIHQVRVGQYVTGYVHNVQDFGAFVDFGAGKHGLLHNKEVPDTERSKIKSGVRLNVFVISCEIRNSRARIGLSFSQTPMDRRSHSRSRERTSNSRSQPRQMGRTQPPLLGMPRQNTSFVPRGMLKRGRSEGPGVDSGLYHNLQPSLKRHQMHEGNLPQGAVKPILYPLGSSQNGQQQHPTGVMPFQAYQQSSSGGIGRGRGTNNLPAWMTQPQVQHAAPIMQMQQQPVVQQPLVGTAPSAGRGAGAVNNMPAWMMQQQQVQQQQPATNENGVDLQVLGLLDMIAGGK